MVLGVATTLVGGCLPLHEPPKAGQPAATVKFRLSHLHKPRCHTFGSNALSNACRLRSLLTIDNRQVTYEPNPSGVVATWTRVKPGWRTFRLNSHWFHTWSTTRREQYTESRRTTCGTTYDSYTKSYKTKYCTKYEKKYRDVTRHHSARRASCDAGLAVYTRKGRTYLFTYSYLGASSCRLICHQQVHKPGGQFQLIPCAFSK